MRASSLPDPSATCRLGHLQRWMQACIVGPEPVPLAAAEDLIRPSRTLAPLDRLDIYRSMYESRLIEALRIDYPGLIALLGEETFAELAQLYIAACPSRSYTLNRLGDRLPDFISQVDGLRRPRFVEALARLELVETFVFDEIESPVATAAAIRSVPESQWASLRLTPIRALRLLRLCYPAQEFLQAMRRNQPLPSLRPRATRLVVYRRDYGLFHLPLTEPAFALFQGLAEGRTLAESMELSFAAGGMSQKQVFSWFHRWFSEGLFTHVATEPP